MIFKKLKDKLMQNIPFMVRDLKKMLAGSNIAFSDLFKRLNNKKISINICPIFFIRNSIRRNKWDFFLKLY